MKKNIIIGIIATALIVLLLILLFVLKSNNKPIEKKYKDVSGKYYVSIKVKDLGEIKLELYADVAPITVANFLNLVDQKFYDGLTFHRIINGFMIQGGDPKGNGTGGSKEKIKGEFAENGVENSISHKRGVISMARSENNNSASSQFFIMHQDNTQLDGKYAAFGQVYSGMNIVDKIAESANPIDNNGTIVKEEQPIIESIRIMDGI